MKKLCCYIAFLFAVQMLPAQDFIFSGTLISDFDSLAVSNVNISAEGTDYKTVSDAQGKFSLALPAGKYKILFTHIGFRQKKVHADLSKSHVSVSLTLASHIMELGITTVIGSNNGSFATSRLGAVSDMGIYEAKKSEVISPSQLVMNTTANNARQLYSRIPGLNIWESDGAGLQLGVGARGLSPDRSSNFNTRQNGYDISADALGYPESYYTPPVEAVEKIEIVRGAASLQYGTQFGGLLNFRFKEGPEDKVFEWTGKAGYGLYNLFNTFHSFGGNKGKVNYYTYYQFKHSDGWRPNSDFNLHNAYAKVRITGTERFAVSFEYTVMHYLAHQPGGLTDAQFQDDPSQSVRARNWFRIFWNIPAIIFDVKIARNTELNIRNFGLIASRDALGILDKINVVDVGGNRTFLSDDYRNVGNETRLLQRYKLGKNYSVFLGGIRLYRGYTHRRQGDGNDVSGPDFYFLHPDSLENSDYRFLSNNIAAFAENIFRIHPKFSITPGVRFEYIQTTADGYYRQTVKDAGGNVISSVTTNERLERGRFVFLAGIGLSYKPLEWLELYGNFSQNYRAITFNDLRVVNPNFKVDENLQDEKGFNTDLGLRGNYKDKLYFDVSVFCLAYQNRIGMVLKADEPPLYIPYRFRTNIGDSRNLGLEAYVEADVLRFCKNVKEDWGFSLFLNGSYINAVYLNTKDASINHKEVELVPPFNIKSGFIFRWKNFAFSCQAGYTYRQYTDATNAVFTASAVSGIIPSYWVMDLGFKYTYKFMSFDAGVNNFTNNMYFTRRATGYPGPGIIPSDGITFYVSMQVKLGVKAAKK